MSSIPYIPLPIGTSVSVQQPLPGTRRGPPEGPSCVQQYLMPANSTVKICAVNKQDRSRTSITPGVQPHLSAAIDPGQETIHDYSYTLSASLGELHIHYERGGRLHFKGFHGYIPHGLLGESIGHDPAENPYSMSVEVFLLQPLEYFVTSSTGAKTTAFLSRGTRMIITSLPATLHGTGLSLDVRIHRFHYAIQVARPLPGHTWEWKSNYWVPASMVTPLP